MATLSMTRASIRFRKPLPPSLSRNDLYRLNLKIASLGRSGDLAAARSLFDRMPARDVVTWNAFLTAHWRNGSMDGAKQLFRLMPERNVVSWNSMIAGCLENGDPDEAFGYFDKMPRRNVASWNAMISGFLKYDRFDEAERLFAEMPVRNVISYTAMVDGLAQKGEMRRARELFDNMPDKNVVSWAVMISGYVENGMFEEARTMFDLMPEKNVVAHTAMITCHSKEGDIEAARNLFDRIQHKDVVAWNAMMAGYVQNACSQDALKLHIQMLGSGFKPDHATLIAVFMACSDLALLQQGRQSHAFAIKSRLKSKISLCNALITMYSRCGCISDSLLAFQKTKNRDVFTWNSIIAACTQHGLYSEVLSLVHDMEANEFVPNDITFVSILSACGHVGMVDESLSWFDLMVHKYRITPRAEHYACVVDILSRAGQLDKACKYIEEMPFEAESVVWGSLLSACQMYSHVDLGELAAEKLVKLDSKSSGAYVMLSNIYAAAGKWKEVSRMRGLMKDQGVKKRPGCSWIEIADKVHMFLVGDASHPEIYKIRSELERIGLHMKMIVDDADELL